ncbi:hypothetical protein EDD36DRAFT_459950 [Exophiala viscosa]|uniref:Uncharacterized protein n=1 Tax=Exophiala viscosa TaxID=2486360 RepID=A0AAN6E583_9EURO|nr:hypothetical protein EDD36DRAFT_459950 [Exophiala viscosa]
MEPPRPRPSLPPRPAATPAPPQRFQAAQDAANHAPGGRKFKPLVYALGIAGIAGSGALIGAILKMSAQEETGKARHQQAQTQQGQPVPTDYSKPIQTLETKRGHLMTQKIQLERKIQDLHKSQHEKAEEEQIKKEIGLKR